MPPPPKQAVLFIHGVGNQRPMESLGDLVDVLWTHDTSVHHPHAKTGLWSKPDRLSDNFELRRLTTSRNAHNVRTDFYEYYWAHLMGGTMLSHVLGWARTLLWRKPWTIPGKLLGVWFLFVALAAVVLFFAVQTVLPASVAWVPLPAWLTAGIGLLTAFVAVPALEKVVGDVARYLHPTPENVQRRQEIRAKGVDLLEKLHQAGYERIIVVGHSLGGVIGYDILTHAWARYNEGGDLSRAHPAMDALEAAVVARGPDPDHYQTLQRAMMAELVDNGYGWRVTDFVTCGNPMTHAQLLLADDALQLKSKQLMREFPTCPPELDQERISYPSRRARRKPHYAAVFGPTRWTNLFFPSRWLIFGDLIGGPVGGGLFGEGIKDVPVETTRRLGLAAHWLYWQPSSKDNGNPGSHVEALRAAVRLAEAWPPEAEPEPMTESDDSEVDEP